MKRPWHAITERGATSVMLAVVLLAAGCATRIDSVTVSPVREGESATVTVKVTPFLTTPRTPSMQARNDSFGSPYQPAGTLPSTGSNEFGGPMAPQLYGLNTLKVEVPYTIVLPPAVLSTSREQPFIVGARAACFAFDATQPNAQGWTMAGLFADGDPQAQIAICNQGPGGAPGISGTPPRTTGDNVPTVFETGFGALTYTLPAACFPAALPAGARYWAIDFRSPDLAARPDWQAYRVSFAIRAADVLVLTQPGWPRVQVILKVRKPDGNVSYFAEVAGTEFRFEPITASWQRFTFTAQPPAGSAVLQVWIRVFAQRLVTIPDAWVRLDLVCPE